MNKKMQIVVMTLCMVLLLAWGGFSTAQAKSVAFCIYGETVGTGGYGVYPGQTAGLPAVEQIGWNTFGTADPQPAGLIDNTETVVPGLVVSFDPTNQIAWCNWDDPAGNPNDFMYCVGTAGKRDPGQASVIITGIPYASYDIYVYVSALDGPGIDPGTDGKITVGATSYYFHAVQFDGSTFTKATRTTVPSPIGTAPVGNYCQFTGLSGASQTITAESIGATDNGAAICGFQIVQAAGARVQLAFTSPGAGQTYDAGTTVDVAATAAGSGGLSVAKVDFYLAGTLLASVASPGPYTCDFVAPPLAGTFPLKAVATDNVAGTWEETMNVSFAAPAAGVGTVVITSPEADTLGTIGTTFTLTAKASGFASSVTDITLFVNMLPVGSGAPDSNGGFSVDWTPTAAGAYLITAMATDSGAVTKSTARAITITVPVYVKTVAEGAADGSDWANAKTLDNAIKDTILGNAFYIHAGTYTVTKPYTITKMPIQFYGGFAGTETSLSERVANYQTVNATILDGGRATRMMDLSSCTLVADGMTFANAFDDGGASIAYTIAGGTGLSSSGNVARTITNCVFSNCGVRGNGGALHLAGGTATISGCTFTGNSAFGPYTAGGGAVYFGDAGGGGSNYGSPAAAVTAVMSDCTFTSNTSYAMSAGALKMDYGKLTATNCTFSDNHAGWIGLNPWSWAPGFAGAMSIWNAGFALDSCKFLNNDAHVWAGAFEANAASYGGLTNCLFAGNQSGLLPGGTPNGMGGAVVVTNAGAKCALVNCTFYGNDAVDSDADGVYDNADGSSVLDIANCIFANQAADAVTIETAGNVTLQTNLMENNTTMNKITGTPTENTGLLTAAPGFVSAGTGNFNLTSSSAAKNAGIAVNYDMTGGIFIATPTHDLAQRARLDTPDLGAYEVGAPSTISLSPDPLLFTALEGTSAKKTLAISVVSGNEPVQITGGGVTGAEFSLVGTPFATPTTLLAGGTMNVTVAFTAPVVGLRTEYSGEMSVTNSGTVSPKTSALEGLGITSLLPIDTRPTCVITRSAHTVTPTSILPIEFDVVFSEGVSGLAMDDVTWAGSPDLDATIIPLGTDGKRYTLQVTAVHAATATLHPSIVDKAAKSIALLPSQASTEGSPAPEVTYTDANLSVAIWTTQAPVTDAATVTYTVTFPEAVGGFSASDLVLDPAPAGSTIGTPVETNPSTAWTVEVTPGGDGPLCLALNDNDQISKDSDPSAKLNGTGTGGVLYGNTTEVDTTAAALVSIKRAFGAPLTTRETIVIFEVKFDDAVTGVDASDFVLTNSDPSPTISTVAAIDADTVYVICDTGTAYGVFGLVLSPTAAITDQMARTVAAPGAPDPLEHFVVLMNPAVPTAVRDWMLY